MRGVSGKIKLLIAANNQLLISSSWECFAGGVNEHKMLRQLTHFEAAANVGILTRP